jgi:hypothetical protein
LSLAPADLAVAFTTVDAAGFAVLPIPIPANPSLLGVTRHVQALAVDASGPVTVGGVGYQVSDARKILIW